MPDVRIARLLRLITLLRARAALNAKDIARQLRMSVRTVYRDLNALRLAGVPCQFDADNGGYRITGDFFLPPVQLTLSEALAISVLGSQLARRRQVPFLDDAWQAVTKVRSQLPAAIREEVADADQYVHVDGARVSPQVGCEGRFAILRRAIAQKRKVRCTYDGGPGKGISKPFLFRPYTLLFSQRAWYAIGHSELRGAERSLKLNRLVTLEATDRPYMIPQGWTVEKCLGKAWRMIRGERRYAVRIRFDEEASRNVADTLWHSTQTITWQPDGSCLFACEVDGLDEIIWWILGYGPHAEVLAPAELRQRVRADVEQLSAVYAAAPPPDPQRQPQRKSPARRQLVRA